MMLNALTIDLEDYFQVHAFSNVIKYKDWGKFECRIKCNTDRLLEILNSVPRNNHSITHSPNDSLTQESNDSSGFLPCGVPYSSYVAQRATFFILGWIAERYPDLVCRIQKEGHEIACHGYAHQLIYNQARDEFRQDIKRAKAILEDITGSEVIGYRAPSYSITSKSQWALETLMDEGFKYDSSIFPIRHDFYGMPAAPRFPFLISLNGTNNFEFSMLSFDKQQHSSTAARNPLIEFPVSTVKLFGHNLPLSGGGYFRLFPYPLIRSGLARINEDEKKPFIFYLHPWEIDPEQPRVNGLSSRSKFRHYVNLDKTGRKFTKLLEDFNFSPVKKILELNNLIT